MKRLALLAFRFSLFLLASGLWLLSSASAQQINIGLSVQYNHVYDPAKPMMTFQQGPTSTGDLTRWFSRAGALMCSISNDGVMSGPGCPGGGSGSVTNFSAGDLSPLFTTSVANPHTSPALSFTQSNAAANTVFGNFTGVPAPPSFGAISSLPISLRWDQVSDEVVMTGYDKQAEMQGYFLDFDNIPALGLASSTGSICIGGLNSASAAASCLGVSAIGLGPGAISAGLGSITIGDLASVAADASISIGTSGSVTATGISGTSFTGVGLDDAVFGGTYSSNSTLNYCVEIDSVDVTDTIPDTFEWGTGGSCSNGGSLIPITPGVPQMLSNGVTVTFTNANGHTLSDAWGASAYPVSNAIAIGNSAVGSGINCVAIGLDSSCAGQNTVSIGTLASTASFNHPSIAIGSTVSAPFDDDIVIGDSSYASGPLNVVIGTNATAIAGASDAVLLGDGPYCENVGCVAIGDGTVIANSTDSVAIGSDANVYGFPGQHDSISIGHIASNYGADQSIEIGYYTDCSSQLESCIAIGTGANGIASYSVAIGYHAYSVPAAVDGGTGPIAIGNGAISGGTGTQDTIAIGTGALSTATNSIALGTGASIGTANILELPTGFSISIGTDGGITATGCTGGLVITDVVGGIVTGGNCPS